MLYRGKIFRRAIEGDDEWTSNYSIHYDSNRPTHPILIIVVPYSVQTEKRYCKMIFGII